MNPKKMGALVVEALEDIKGKNIMLINVSKLTSLFDYIVREKRPLREMFTADYTFLNKRLAEHYGAKHEFKPGTEKDMVKVDNARFSKMVVPGDQLVLEVTLKRTIRNMALYEGKALVDGKEVASAEMLCAETKAA